MNNTNDLAEFVLINIAQANDKAVLKLTGISINSY